MTFVLITLAITLIHVRVKVWFDDDDHDDEILWTHITGNVSLN